MKLKYLIFALISLSFLNANAQGEIFIDCGDATTSSVQFSWNGITPSIGYQIKGTLPDGTPLELDTTQSSYYTVDSLPVIGPRAVNFQVTNILPDGMLGDSATRICNLLNCPDFDLFLSSPGGPFCLGDSTEFFVTGFDASGLAVDGFYTYSGPGISPSGIFSIRDLPVGVYDIFFTYDEHGCIATTSTSYEIIDHPVIVPMCEIKNGSVEISWNKTNFAPYQVWINGDREKITSDTFYTYNPAINNEELKIWITTDFSRFCGESKSDTIRCTGPNLSKSQDTHGLSDIKIFPNPATNHIAIQSETKFDKAEILNLEGVVVLETSESKLIEIEHLPKGTYLIKLFTQRELYIEKVVIY